MLTLGNQKLGQKLIWGFTLPSGTDAVCPGRTTVCSRYCYSKRLEVLRPKVHKAYRRNLMLTKRKDFSRRVYHFVRAHRVRVVRIHVGGDFYSAEYAQKWLRIIEHSPRVRFYFYTRSWRDPPIRLVVEQMAALPNCSAWYSCDRETGVPEDVSPGIRLAWLQVVAHEVIPNQVDLVFRRHGLRRVPLLTADSHICPEQDGIARSSKVTCQQCQLCIRSTPDVVVASSVAGEANS